MPGLFCLEMDVEYFFEKRIENMPCRAYNRKKKPGGYK